MASSEVAERLTVAHQEAQSRRAALLALLLLQRWRSVNADDLEPSFATWLAAAVPEILRYRRQSAQLAGRYYTTFRSVELGDLSGVDLKLSETIERQRLETSLRVTGLISFKKRMRTIVADEPTIAESLETSGQMAAAAAVRHALDGGRQTIKDTSAADERALGTIRMTRANPCWFCAMLASRGPVYKGASFDESDARFEGEGKAKVHDGCGCSLETVFLGGADWPGRAREFEQMWKDATPRPGESKANAFRRRYEGRD